MIKHRMFNLIAWSMVWCSYHILQNCFTTVMIKTNSYIKAEGNLPNINLAKPGFNSFNSTT